MIRFKSVKFSLIWTDFVLFGNYRGGDEGGGGRAWRWVGRGREGDGSTGVNNRTGGDVVRNFIQLFK